MEDDDASFEVSADPSGPSLSSSIVINSINLELTSSASARVSGEKENTVLFQIHKQYNFEKQQHIKFPDKLQQEV